MITPDAWAQQMYQEAEQPSPLGQYPTLDDYTRVFDQLASTKRGGYTVVAQRQRVPLQSHANQADTMIATTNFPVWEGVTTNFPVLGDVTSHG
mgnify:CR=1 FL=1